MRRFSREHIHQVMDELDSELNAGQDTEPVAGTMVEFPDFKTPAEWFFNPHHLVIKPERPIRVGELFIVQHYTDPVPSYAKVGVVLAQPCGHAHIQFVYVDENGKQFKPAPNVVTLPKEEVSTGLPAATDWIPGQCDTKVSLIKCLAELVDVFKINAPFACVNWSGTLIDPVNFTAWCDLVLHPPDDNMKVHRLRYMQQFNLPPETMYQCLDQGPEQMLSVIHQFGSQFLAGMLRIHSGVFTEIAPSLPPEFFNADGGLK